jgi:hypothetical protein
MSPKSKKLSVTSSEDTYLMGAGLKAFTVINEGTTTCQVDFDRSVTDDSWQLLAGQGIELEASVIRLFFKTSSGTTTLRVLKVLP